MLLLPGETPEQAAELAERLCTTLAASPATCAGKQMLTTSIGVAAAGLGKQLDAVLEQADRALYQAKHAGRNRVVRQPPDPASPGGRVKLA